jgi:hypothetical protein
VPGMEDGTMVGVLAARASMLAAQPFMVTAMDMAGAM